MFDLIEKNDIDVDDDVDNDDEGDDFDQIDDDVNYQFYHHSDDHIPARYDLTENDDFDREEIATYEEVARLFPRTGRYRPIILIGELSS